jgi:protein-tyrosine phosphatase
VAAVCTGNICRSPMAEVLLKHLVADDANLRGHVIVTSAGTARWHVGSPMDPRARRALDRAGYRLAGTPARFADSDYVAAQDLVLVMTREQRDEISGRVRGATEVRLWRDLSEPGLGLDVADPYYGDDRDFDACLRQLSSAAPQVTSEFRRRWDARSHGA